mmetsp:Transcript_10785/g.35354  ORF Transcript_10785/g.35354 Transcript_10785/m.35354 type:complete len:298 (+) Transcript_10785:1326-2219(+)
MRSSSSSAALRPSSFCSFMMDSSARSVSSSSASALYRTSAFRFSSFCLCTSRIPARSLLASARRESSAFDSRCSDRSSSSREKLPPFSLSHTLRAATARLCASPTAARKSKPSPSPSAAPGRGGSTARGSSRALAITRRSFGTDCATAPAEALYRGATSASAVSAERCRPRRACSSSGVSTAAWHASSPRSARRRERMAPKSMSRRMDGSALKSSSSRSANSASSTVLRCPMEREMSARREKRSFEASTSHSRSRSLSSAASSADAADAAAAPTASAAAGASRGEPTARAAGAPRER